MSTPERTAALNALTTVDLFEAAVALTDHIDRIKLIMPYAKDATPWQRRLEAAQRAHDLITAARIAE